MVPSTHRHRPLVLLLFLLSGATGLVYEVLWLRQLILIFGSTIHATSTVLATFMGGLAAGAFLAGRSRSLGRRPPLAVYGWIEILIGVYALLVPFLFRLLTPLYRAVWSAGAADNFALLSLAKFAGIALVLLPPTILMGASLPVLSRVIASDDRRVGGQIGRLYAINTFGAVAGTFLAGFVLIPSFGMQRTTLGTAAVNVAIGLVALAFARAVALPAPSPAAGPAAVSEKTSGRGRLVLAAFALSGCAAMVLEVAWTRGLVLVLGSSVYAFALMLVAFLIGLASGGAAISGWLVRRPGRDPAPLLAGLLLAAGLLAWATAFVFQFLPGIFGRLFVAWSPGPNLLFAIQLVFGLMIMFPATFAFGGIFPAVLQLHARGVDGVARSVGTVYAANTGGTIAGSVLAGFLLVPLLGVRDTIVTIAALEALLALLVALVVLRRGALRTALVVAALAAATLPFALRPGWNVLMMNSGVYMNIHTFEGADDPWERFKRSMLEGVELVYVEEGLSATVMVADEPRFGNRFLSVSGKVEASTNADMETQLACAHLPLLLHPAPRDVMVIGLASGISAGGAATHPIDSLRIVEIERAMVPAARLFDDHNGRVLDDPRVTLSINDARNELEFSDATYDVIVSEPSNPWMTVASNLFTEDFFKMAATRLREGGIYSQWVQNYYLGGEEIRAVVAAFREAFPETTIFETFDGVDLLLLGSATPLPLDLERIETRMTELQVSMDLARIKARSAWDLLALFRLGPREVDRLVDGAARNTDDNARVEFAAPRSFGLDSIEANVALLDRHAGDVLAYLRPAPDPAALPAMRLELIRGCLRRGWTDRARFQLEMLNDPETRDRASALIAEALR